ncbi:MAG TPA: amino acid permease [Devosia sp.]|nr:amino acid permease [Devosia sp.]
MNLPALLFGRPLRNREAEGRKIGWFEAVPAMGLDALGSSSYGPEAALAILAPLGILGSHELAPVTACIVALLAVLYLSYRQTVVAYPVNGGGYVVARDNLGEYPSLLAAAGLLIDYVLNVAVGISAGVGALISAAPQLHAFTLPICLAILLLIVLVNLRGTGEAGWLFALPAYVFVLCFIGIMGFGVFEAVQAGGQPKPAVAPPPVPAGTEAASLWLLVRAFAAGCTAMTGVEAVSNGVGAFREPVVRNAHRTLGIIVAVLGLLLVGVAILAPTFSVAAMDEGRPGYQSVLSQIASAVAGHGIVYYVAMASLLAVLCLSANTSFVAFPRLCRLVAADGYLPRAFALPGRRLVFTGGIVFLAVAAGALILAFGGMTDPLIPLFAVGAFTTFTLSQAGMVGHWRRKDATPWRIGINLVGAVATGIALLVILVAKFSEGAWVTVVAIPVVIVLLKSVRGYYAQVQSELREDGPITLEDLEPPTVVIIAETWNRLSEKAIKFALTISPDVIAVHLVNLEGPEPDKGEQELRRQWARDVAEPVKALGLKPPELKLIPSPYRKLNEPLLHLLKQIDERTPGRAVAVLIPEIVMEHWWQNLLHVRRARRLRAELLAHGGPRLTVASVPWRLGDAPRRRPRRREARKAA